MRIVAFLMFLLAGLAAETGRAATFEELLTGLAADDFAAKVEAIEGLGALGDGRAVAPLAALSDGRLLAGPGGKPLILDGTRLIDAATGAAVQGNAAAMDRVRVNNRLRGAITGALSKLRLFSPDRAERLSAARDAIRYASAESLAALEKALAVETDATVRSAMQTSLYSARLSAGSNAEKLAAIKALSGSLDPQIGASLSRLRDASDTPPELRAAAQEAVAAINQKLQLIEIGQNLFQGLSLGSVLLLAAIGLAITFGVMGVINMAHGEMIMLGAYATFVVQECFRAWFPATAFDYYLIAAVPVAFVVAGVAGIIIERTVIRFLYGRALETLLATWGISLMLQQAVRSIFGATNREVANPAWMTGGFEVIGGFGITWNRLAILVFCFVVLGALVFLLRRTPLGLHMRAVTQNRSMASVMGIPTARVDALTFGLGSGIAGIAGVALSQIGNVSPNLGQIYIVDSFLVVVFGGVGNLMGTLVGSMTIGIANKLLEPMAGAVLGKIILLVAVILFIQRRPRGLFALKGRAVDA